MAKFKNQDASEDRMNIVIVPEVLSELSDRMKVKGIDVTSDVIEKIYREAMDILISKYNTNEILDYLARVAIQRNKKRSMV